MAKVSTAAQTGVLIPGPGALKASAIQAGLISLSNDQQEMVNKAKKYAMEQSIKSVLTKQSLAHQQQQQKSLQRHQALVLMCRVYVGSISFELKEDTIRQAFTSFGPIKSINMSWDAVTQKHKGFAFVEYDLPEAAQLALDLMNGVMLGGRNIKVGRPSNMPQAAPFIQQITEEAKDHNRVYVASIRQDLSEQDIQTVFGAFGVIKSCKLAQSGIAGQHKGYGFIEYENEQSVNDAVTAMQNFDLGGQSLKVGRATTPPENLSSTGTIANPVTTPTSASMVPAGAINILSKIQSIDESSNPVSPNILPSNDSNRVPSTSPMATSPSNANASITPNNQQSTKNHHNNNNSIDTNNVNLHLTGLEISNPASNTIDVGCISTLSSTTLQNNNNNDIMNNQINSTHHQSDRLSPSNLNDDQDSLQYQENLMTIKGAQGRALLMQRLLRRNESRVCVLKNMVSIDEVDDDLKLEVSEECGQYGQLVSVVIYIDKLSEVGDILDVSVKIFVEFKEASGAEKAKDSLDGRFFGGKKVIAEIYDQNLFDACDYAG